MLVGCTLPSLRLSPWQYGTLIEQAWSARGPPTAPYSSHVVACAHRCALEPRPLVLLSTPDTGTGTGLLLSRLLVWHVHLHARSLGPSRLRAPSHDRPGSAHASRARRYWIASAPRRVSLHPPFRKDRVAAPPSRRLTLPPPLPLTAATPLLRPPALCSSLRTPSPGPGLSTRSEVHA